MSSFQQGLSGLNSTSKNLEVIGHNIANANTFGAKSSRAEFADMYASALGSANSANQVGIGVNLQTVAQQFTQGSITTTEVPLDLAINGEGFFQVSEGNNNPTMYTRNGQFKVDKQGYIVNNAGQKLLGYPADATGTIQPGQSGQLQLPTAGIEPLATTSTALELNLDSRLAGTAPTDATAQQINFTDPSTYNNATSVTVYDAKGQEVAMTYYFQKVAPTTDSTTTPPTVTNADTWNVYITANGTPVSGTADAPQRSVQIQFASNGTTPSFTPSPVTVDVPASVNAAGAQTLAIAGMALDLTEVTQLGAKFGVTDQIQNGYAPGQLSGVTIEDNGVIMARYSNGESKPAGQIEIANFRNPQGLMAQGGNLWTRSFASGDPIVGVAGDGNFGVLQSGALEESNVDLTAELVNMITAQRVYQANAQTIKTQDSLLQTLVSLR